MLLKGKPRVERFLVKAPAGENSVFKTGKREKKMFLFAPFSRCWYQFSLRNTKIYKICNLHRLTFSTFYNVSQPNFAILLILGCSSMLW